MGDFGARIEVLKELVGEGDLTGKVVVNQHYAQYQHETFGLNHPRGGGPHFLSNPLYQGGAGYIQNLADNVLDGGLIMAQSENMEDLSSKLDPAAPIDADPNPIRLRRSGNPIVLDNGAEVYNRAPIDPPEPPGVSNDRLPPGGR